MDRERDGMPVTALREMRILASSAHPHIVRLRHVASGPRADAIFLVFEYAEHDLAAILDAATAQRAPPPFTLAEVKTLVSHLLSAVAFLHRKCVLHRDLKLSNLVRACAATARARVDLQLDTGCLLPVRSCTRTAAC